MAGGLAFANAVAVAWGWLGGEAAFVRTPKWGRPGESALAPGLDEAASRRHWPGHLVLELVLFAVAAGGAVLVLLRQPGGAFALWPQATAWCGLAAFAWTARPRIPWSARRSSPVSVSTSPEGVA